MRIVTNKLCANENSVSRESIRRGLGGGEGYFNI